MRELADTKLATVGRILYSMIFMQIVQMPMQLKGRKQLGPTNGLTLTLHNCSCYESKMCVRTPRGILFLRYNEESWSLMQRTQKLDIYSSDLPHNLLHKVPQSN